MDWEGLIKVANIIVWSMIVGACLGLLCGCEEAQQQWGQGDPPLGWQKDFGNSNIARLDFVQTQMLNKHANELVQLVDRIKKLEEAQDTEE